MKSSRIGKRNGEAPKIQALPPTPKGGGREQNPRGVVEGDIPNSMLYHSIYNETQWRALPDKVGLMRDAINWSMSLGMTLPMSPRDASKESYPSYSVKGLCNSRFWRVGDYQAYPPGEDRALMAWENKVIL